MKEEKVNEILNMYLEQKNKDARFSLELIIKDLENYKKTIENVVVNLKETQKILDI